jgi:hypothetical protein
MLSFCGGVDVSVIVRLDHKVKATISPISDDAWTPIKYTDAVFDELTQTLIARAEVFEVAFTAFTSKKKTEQVTGRLMVRQIPDLNPKNYHGQERLFDPQRFHAFRHHQPHRTADKTHRGHAIIDQDHHQHLTTQPTPTRRPSW